MTTRPRNQLIGLLATMALFSAACAGGAAVQARAPSTTAPAAPTPPPTTATPAPSVPITTSSSQPPAVTTTNPPPTTTLEPAPSARFVVDAAEVHSAAKQLGVDIAQQLTNYSRTSAALDLAEAVAPDGGAELAAALDPIHHPGQWSRGTIIYPQLGGMTDTAGSIMVVVRQEVGTADSVELVETRTFDIRLRVVDGEWAFDHVASVGGEAIARPADLPAEAVAVLDNPRIELPDSARWDIYRGHTSPALLRVMSELADQTAFGVVVLASGHPHNVFATDRTSNHSVGRAVDVYRIGDARVIDDRAEGSPTATVLRWLYDRDDIYKVGGPWALDGAGGRSFTNVVHQDHIHISVNR